MSIDTLILLARNMIDKKVFSAKHINVIIEHWHNLFKCLLSKDNNAGWMD